MVKPLPKKAARTFRGWFTKYALTTGVVVGTCETSDHNPKRVQVKVNGKSRGAGYIGRDVFETEDAANQKVLSMIEAKLKSLERKRDRLELMRLELGRDKVEANEAYGKHASVVPGETQSAFEDD